MAEAPGRSSPATPQPPPSSSSVVAAAAASVSSCSSSSAAAALDPEFPPQSRPRSCTWPLPRPEPEPGGGGGGGEGPGSGLGSPEEPGAATGAAAAAAASASSSCGPGGGPGSVGGRKSGGGSGSGSGGARRNAWGSQSYADLISQAIESAPDKRLTLAQIYEWMVRSVPYFRDKGDSNSSAGWKNSIRHNLSLHSKFMKVHNEATGKSSWWMLNPEGGKSGKAPRRRAASMDNSSKLAKVRGKASKKKAAMQVAPEPTADSPGSQYSKWPGSPSSRSNEDSDVWTSIRPRTSSNASNLSVRLSPILTEQDDLPDEDLLPSLVYAGAPNNVPPTVTEELELIDSLNLMSPSSSLLPPAPQQGSSSLAQRNASFPLRGQSSTAQASSFSSSLFSPVEISLHGSAGHFSGPQTLEALLTSNSPPPSDVMMTQVDPILPQSGGRLNSQTFLLLGEQPSKSKVGSVNQLRKPLEQQQQQQDSVGAGALSSGFSMVASAQNTVGMSGLKTSSSSTQSPQVVQLGTQPPLSGATFAPFGGNQDRLPNDLDVDMYMENLECDVDYIINTDLMDGEGLDFNFEPIPSAPSYPSTSQASNHTWVPS